MRQLLARLTRLIKLARSSRDETNDVDLRWELTSIESSATVLLHHADSISEQTMQANVDYLNNLLIEVRRRMAP